MIHLHLTAEQRQELQRVSRQAVGRVALRAHMVLLSDRGYSVPQIATIHHCGQDVARTCLHRYKDKGVAGLEDEPRSGRPPKDPLARQIVDMQASQSPPCSGHGQTCWTVATLTAFLATRFGLLLSRASVRRHLRAREQLIGLRFYLLAAYVGVEALRSLLTHEVPAASWVGDDLDLAARQQARPAARLGRQPGGAGRGAGPAPGDDGQQVPHTGAGPVDGGAAVGDCYARRALTRRRRPRLHGAGPLIEQRYMHSNGRWRRVAP